LPPARCSSGTTTAPVPQATVMPCGDAAITVADPSLATKRLGWRTSRTLADMCRDGWVWQSANPGGYGA
jgi:UDP-glucose 4-epimerase